MIANMITVDDLQTFKANLLEDIINILEQRRAMPARKWLKSHEVRRLLTISPNTLQALRENGNLPYTKIGGVIYYDFDDIKQMLDQNKTNSKNPPNLTGNKTNTSHLRP